MKQITDPDGYPNVFSLDSNDGDLWLDTYNARPDRRWLADDRIVFRRRK